MPGWYEIYFSKWNEWVAYCAQRNAMVRLGKCFYEGKETKLGEEKKALKNTHTKCQ